MRMLRLLPVLGSILLLPSVASAQAPPDWTMDVKLGKPIYVTLLNGDRLEGLAGSVTEEGIAVATPVGVRTARFNAIRKVERRDGPWNGIWTGVAVGAALGILAISIDDGCRSTGSFAYDNSSCNAEAAAVPIAGGIYGGLAGWGIDTMRKGRRPVFDSKAQGAKLSFAATRDGIRGRVTFNW